MQGSQQSAAKPQRVTEAQSITKRLRDSSHTRGKKKTPPKTTQKEHEKKLEEQHRFKHSERVVGNGLVIFLIVIVLVFQDTCATPDSRSTLASASVSGLHDVPTARARSLLDVVVAASALGAVAGLSDGASSCFDDDAGENMNLLKSKRCDPLVVFVPALASMSSSMSKDTFGDKRTGEPKYEKGMSPLVTPRKEETNVGCNEIHKLAYSVP